MSEQTPDKDDRPDKKEASADEGQISELHDMTEAQAGGADATDKSTGNAPDHDGEADRS